MLADTLRDMYQYFFKDDLRPIFRPESARVCIEVKDEKLAIAFRPESDLGAAKAVVAAALVALSEKSFGDFINPFEVMFGAIVQDREPEGGVADRIGELGKATTS